MLAGANVYVAEVNEKVWPLAKEIGATDVKASIKDFEGVTFDVIVDFAGFGTTTAEAITTVKERGTVVLVGMGKLEATIDTQAMIMSAVTFKGNKGGTKEDIAGVYEYMASGELDPTITTIGFDEIPEGIEKLKNGEVVGRLVASYE
ncbi:zinc-binding dehydrogenase [Micrococcus terreus]|uniref:zinc-binding dehydrogenase n=1 Tax=Micrococcus terreus TaxID=574650 RepID=UPI003D74FFFE